MLEVRDIERVSKLHGVSLSAQPRRNTRYRRLVGAGRTELLRSISGADGIDSGEIIIDGHAVTLPTPAKMKWLGIGLIPENRKEEGLVLSLNTRENICLASLGRIAWRGVIWKARQAPAVRRNVEGLHIAVHDVEAPVTTLSGGNQQKVVVGKWLNTEPRVLLLDEPTRGIDIQAKQQIFQLIWDLSKQGISTIFVSSELEELVDVCHRIVVMREGRIVGEVSPDSITPQKLFEYCVGAGAPVEGIKCLKQSWAETPGNGCPGP